MSEGRINRIRALLKNLEAKSTEASARILSEAEQLIYELSTRRDTINPAEDPETADQIAAVMLQTGSKEQQEDALASLIGWRARADHVAKLEARVAELEAMIGDQGPIGWIDAFYEGKIGRADYVTADIFAVEQIGMFPIYAYPPPPVERKNA